MKYLTKLTCPCEDKTFTLSYYSDDGKVETIYCPFCSAEIEEYSAPKDEDESEDDD